MAAASDGRRSHLATHTLDAGHGDGRTTNPTLISVTDRKTVTEEGLVGGGGGERRWGREGGRTIEQGWGGERERRGGREGEKRQSTDTRERDSDMQKQRHDNPLTRESQRQRCTCN